MYSVSSAYDPVTEFIVQSDSIARTLHDEALGRYVSDNLVLAGAAVGQLAGVAAQIREEGQIEAAEENLALAKHIALLYRKQTGSQAPLDLVATYRAWEPEQRALRLRARALEQEATGARDAGEIDRAITLMAEAMTLYESIGDKRSIAVLWGSLGIAYWYKGDFRAVAEQYDKALTARRAIEDRILEGRTLNGLGSVNYQLGNLDVALGYYRQAIDLRRQTGDIDGLATSLTYLGNTYLAMGRMVDARIALEQALPVVEQSGNTTRQYELLTSIGSLNAEMGRMSSSNDAIREALALAGRMGDPHRQIICHNNLALNLAEAYRYREALGELDAAKALIDQHPDPEQTAVYYRNSGITNLRVGELEWARGDFDNLLQLATEYQMPALELEALINLGYLHKEQAKYEEGLLYAERALALAEDLGNPRMVRESLVLAAEMDQNLARYDMAIEKWNVLLSRDRADSAEANVAMDLMGVANNWVLAGRSEEARRILRDVSPVVESTQEGDLMLALAFGMGHSFEKSDPESARFYYDRALRLIDETRREIGGTEVRTGYLGGVRRFYFEEVATYYAGLAEGDQAEVWSARAFETIERAKARGLLDLIEAALLASGSSAEDALLDSLYSLDPDLPGYADRRRRLKHLYARARQERFDSLAGGRVQSGDVASPDDIRRLLPERTAFLVYALGDTASLLWAIDSDGCLVYRLPERATLEEAVARLRDAIAHPLIGDEALRRSAHELYTALVAPAQDRLGEATELIVVPDGVLFELPFEVLLTQEPSGKTGWKDMPYLARAYSVTYVPSASIYVALKTDRSDTHFDKDLLALGDPDYTMLGSLSGFRDRIVRLPYSREEVLKISSDLEDGQKDINLGQDANEAVLKAKLRTESVRVVHLAAHGIVDPMEPTGSGIVLCPDPERTEDGYLQTLEVMSLPMRVGLVVLSACESARGQIGRGEGVVGLSRAFLASGARGVVASLWPVSDESTAELMEEFYRQMLGKKHPASQAMNEARFALINDTRYAHPFHWSSFVVIGLEDSPW
jgi:CHAT domain-containing protein/Tfp pilus assembly protein PilF